MRADEYQKQQEEHEQWERAKKAQKELSKYLKESNSNVSQSNKTKIKTSTVRFWP